MMLPTCTCGPPRWEAMLPQKLSAAPPWIAREADVDPADAGSLVAPHAVVPATAQIAAVPSANLRHPHTTGLSRMTTLANESRYHVRGQVAVHPSRSPARSV